MSVFSRFPEVAHFTSVPAALIDKEYLKEKKGFFNFIWTFLKIRAIYVGLFIPLAVVDLFVSFCLAITNAIKSLVTIDEAQDRSLKLQKQYATIFSRTFFSLIATLLGIISPKLIAFYFTPERTKKGVVAGGRYHKDKEAELVSPKNEEELIQLIHDAQKNGDKIMPIGAGFSQGKQFLPEGGKKAIVVDLSLFDTIEINTKDKTVEVGAGAIWSDIQTKANYLSLALQVMQASNVFSVGGSVGTNIHGWDHINGCVANTIVSMDVIKANGEKVTVLPEDELFKHITGGLGLFGIVTKVKLKLTDNISLKEKGTAVELNEYVKHFRDIVQKSDNTKMHLYRLSLDPSNLLQTGVAVDYDLEGTPTPVKTKNLVQESDRGTRFNQIMINFARRIGWVRKLYWNGERNRLLANDSPPQTINEIMQPPIKAMFNPSVSEAEWLQEFFIPEEALAEFLKELGTLLTDNKVVLLNASVRFVKQHDAPMSYSNKGDRFAVVLCFNQSLREEEIIKAKKWMRKAQNITVQKGGSFYLPYQHVSSPENFNASYPNASAAQQFKKQVDENSIFSSGLYQKYMAPKVDKPNYFKEVMANDEYKKSFDGFLDVVLQRVDKEAFYTLLKEILEYNDTHEEIYTELLHRLPEVMPGTLGSLKRIIDSLSAIKTDLAAQAKAILPTGLKEINGLVEVGYPGRFVAGFQANFNVKGKIVAVNESELLTDYIQTGFPRSYHQFAKLDYSKPNLNDLADSSADVVTCYVGLHHFTEDGVNDFLKEVKRVLRDGGHFLLVDHDAKDEKSLAMANMAHMVFNAVTGVGVKEELEEVRNFKPMSYWKKLLEDHGLGYGIEGADVPMIRKGDPSANRMVSFVKKEPEVSPILSQLQQVNNNEQNLNHPIPVHIPSAKPDRLNDENMTTYKPKS